MCSHGWGSSKAPRWAELRLLEAWMETMSCTSLQAGSVQEESHCFPSTFPTTQISRILPGPAAFLSHLRGCITSPNIRGQSNTFCLRFCLLQGSRRLWCRKLWDFSAFFGCSLSLSCCFWCPICSLVGDCCFKCLCTIFLYINKTAPSNSKKVGGAKRQRGGAKWVKEVHNINNTLNPNLFIS